jgi:hypothetical protein
MRAALIALAAIVVAVPAANADELADGIAALRKKRAAKQGVADAQFQTGNMYAYGLGIPRSDVEVDRKAAKWYFEAARQGHRDAQYALAIMFLAGKGVERDESEATKWMKRAADQGHEDARRYFGK